MVLKVEQERVHQLLKDTITLLCRNGLSFKSQFSVEALIGITLDQDDVFLVNINEIIKTEKQRNDEAREQAHSEHGEVDGSSDSNHASDLESSNRKRRRRKRKSDIKTELVSRSDENSSDGYERLADEEGSLPAKRDSFNNCGNSPLTSTPVLKQDRDEDSMEDIIIIKEEVQEDWPQFCQSNTFPSTSGTDQTILSDTTQQSFLSPSSTFTPSQDGQFDWSQGMSSQAVQQYQAGLSMAQTDHNQQTRWSQLICPLCGISSSTKGNLQKHMKRHAGKYDYHCGICDKGFTSNDALRGHMSWHTGIKDFICDICQAEFRYPQDLKRHKDKVHNNNKG